MADQQELTQDGSKSSMDVSQPLKITPSLPRRSSVTIATKTPRPRDIHNTESPFHPLSSAYSQEFVEKYEIYLKTLLYLMEKSEKSRREMSKIRKHLLMKKSFNNTIRHHTASQNAAASRLRTVIPLFTSRPPAGLWVYCLGSIVLGEGRYPVIITIITETRRSTRLGEMIILSFSSRPSYSIIDYYN